ncbi:MAG: arabinosyltransferase, partial [Mycobacterium sp.]|nr:arabinosyltransferase [Mycobacterium sp.]
GRLLPVAIAGIVGGLTLFSGPTGIASIGALLVAVGPLLTIVRRRSRRSGLLPLLAPLAAAGTVTLFGVFRDQTFAAVAQASALKRAVGPSLTWFDEHIRYARLFLTTPDGAIARRFAVLMLILALAVVVAIMLRRGRIPGTAAGPSRRLVGVTVISLLALMLTPTKWTHHFGVFAGLAGALGALAAVAMAPGVLASRRNRALLAAAALFVTALSFASVNGWWYVAGFGVPWADRMPEFRLGFTTVLLATSVVALLVAAWYQFSGRDHGNPPRGWLGWLAGSPLAVLAWLLVVFEVASLTIGMINQYPAFSVGRSNLQALTGKNCGLADDVLVESGPGMLRPAGGSVSAEGFTANGIAPTIAARPVTEPPAGGNTLGEDPGEDPGQDPADDATAEAFGVTLPFGLDPATPVLGSWRAGVQQTARLRTGWYRLPDPRTEPLVVVSAAGRFAPDSVAVEWATEQQAAAGTAGGSLPLVDIGPAPGWRNLRAPLAAVPAEATLVRVVAVDDDLAPARWIAVTGPRVPALRTLQQEVGSQDPVLLDWLVGLAFPCQRPFGHAYGVTEVPRWRILPGQFDTEANSPVMDNIGGGPLGITELLFRAATVPTYLRDDWSRDWGALQRLT